MTPGKMTSQAGHAFLNAYLQADPLVAKEYHKDGIGTKVCLQVKNESQIRIAYKKAQAANLPCSLIIDSGHVMPPFFDGSPIVTALGIGPVLRHEVNHITDKFELIE